MIPDLFETGTTMGSFKAALFDLDKKRYGCGDLHRETRSFSPVASGVSDAPSAAPVHFPSTAVPGGIVLTFSAIYSFLNPV